MTRRPNEAPISLDRDILAAIVEALETRLDTLNERLDVPGSLGRADYRRALAWARQKERQRIEAQAAIAARRWGSIRGGGREQ